MADANVTPLTRGDAEHDGKGQAHRPAVLPSARRVIFGCACNLLNGTLGPGMLVLPRALSRTGMVAGGMLLLAVWLFAYVALLLLLECCARRGTSNLVALARGVGPRMGAAVDWSVFLYFYGTCISYLILVGGTFDSMLRGSRAHIEALLGSAALGLGEARQRAWRHAIESRGDTALLVAFTLLIMLPLSCSRSIDKLGSYSSGVLFLYSYIAIVVWTCPVAEGAAEAHGAPPAGGFGWGTLHALPTMAYCFSSQAVYPPALESVQQLHSGARARRLSRLLTDATFGITLMAYLGVGVGGYAAMPSAPPANVLNAYERSGSVILAQLCLICALSLSLPIMFVVARMHAFSLATHWLGDAEREERATAPATAAGIVLSLLVAIFFPSVESVLGLLGATCSVSLSFVVPAALYQRLVVAPTPPAERSPWSRAVVYLLVGFGLALAALSIPIQLGEIYKATKPHEDRLEHLAGDLELHSAPSVSR